MKTLLIAAQPKTRQFLSEALKRRGHEVTVVEDADAACTAFPSAGYRLVVLEAEGPHGEGVLPCRRLRAISRDGHCVILAAGRSRKPEHVRKLLAAGADDYLTDLDDTEQLDVRLTVAEHRIDGGNRSRSDQELSDRSLIRCCPILRDALYGVFRADIAGKFLEVNSALVTMLGYDSEEELLTLDVTRDVYRDPALRRRLIPQLIERGHLEAVEAKWKRKDGTPITILASARVLRDDTGAVVEAEGIIHDITEQKRIQEALKATQSRLEYLVSASPAVIYTCIPGGDYGTTFITENVTSQLGYETREFVEDPRFWADRIHPEDAPRVFAELPRVFETGHHAHEYRFLHGDGSYHWIRDELRLARDAAGQPLEIIGYCIDITNRRRAERALAEELQRNRLILKTSMDGFYVLDVEGRFLDANPAICAILGYTRDELLSMSLRDVEALESPREISQRIKEVIQSGVQRFETKHRRKDGELLDVEIGVHHCKLREDEFLFAFVRDVTGRKQAERALQQSESRFRTLLIAIPDMVVLMDRKGCIQYANRPGPEATMDTLIGSNVMEFVVPEHREKYHACHELAFETGDAQAIEVMSPGGHWWSARLVPIVEDGKVRRLMAICTDITEQKRSAEALQKEQQLLRHLLDLHEGERQLVAYEIHDGFSQYVTGALYNLQGFRELQAKKPREAWETFDAGLSLIHQSINEARRLIAGLRPPILDESGIVAAVDYLACEAHENAGAEVEFIHDVKFERLAPPLESAMFRIVQESLTNARRHSRSAKIRIELVQEDDRICIGVRDWGIGFNPAKVEEGRFGLRGIRERARLFGGQVTIETAPQQGTQVSVELPLIETPGEPSEP